MYVNGVPGLAVNIYASQNNNKEESLLLGGYAKKYSGGSNKRETGVSGVGSWGGSCKCPDGQEYLVGDNIDSCKSLACIGGVSGTCSSTPPSGGARVRVTCAGASHPHNMADFYMASVRVYTARLRDEQVVLLHDGFIQSLGTTVNLNLMAARFVRQYSARNNNDTSVTFTQLAVRGVPEDVNAEPFFGVTAFTLEVSRMHSEFAVANGYEDQYVLSAKKGTWHQKQADCAALGRSLASVHSSRQNALVNRVATSAKEPVWIGLYADKWSDGSKLDFLRPSELDVQPSQGYCGSLITNGELSGLWQVVDNCGSTRPAVCGPYLSTVRLANFSVFDQDLVQLVPEQTIATGASKLTSSGLYSADVTRGDASVILDFGAPVAMTSYSFETASDAATVAKPGIRDPATWKIEARNDETPWEVIDDSFSSTAFYKGESRYHSGQGRAQLVGPLRLYSSEMPDNHISHLPFYRHRQGTHVPRWIFGEGDMSDHPSDFRYNVFDLQFGREERVPSSGNWYTSCYVNDSRRPEFKSLYWNVNISNATCVVDVTDDCANNPCGDGGVCADLGANLFNCTCADGYAGGGQNQTCFPDYEDDCTNTTCSHDRHGGTLGVGQCYDTGVHSYSCICEAPSFGCVDV